MMSIRMPPGPVIAAVEGLALTEEDRKRLLHPLVGGLTLFSRNFASARQVTDLCREIHALRDPALLICVDHEGGRVQRFREGFTRLPPMRRIGGLFDQDTAQALAAARAAGLVIALELSQCGVDLSLAPVLDLDYGASTIIGDRAFHTEPDAVCELAGALVDGLHAGGMGAVGKHFPGHGYIAADSHLELPVDGRAFEEIAARDLKPFVALGPRLAGIMPAHVLYSRVDGRPAGFSRYWLRNILRERCRFGGAIFSDDLGMAGAAGEGSLASRALAAFEAGCDVVLACTPADADGLLAELHCDMPDVARRRLLAMHRRPRPEEPASDERLLAAARAAVSSLSA